MPNSCQFLLNWISFFCSRFISFLVTTFSFFWHLGTGDSEAQTSCIVDGSSLYPQEQLFMANGILISVLNAGWYSWLLYLNNEV